MKKRIVKKKYIISKQRARMADLFALIDNAESHVNVANFLIKRAKKQLRQIQLNEK